MNNLKRKLRENNSIYNSIKNKIKYLGINKGGERQNENYKTFLKQIKEDINKWKDIPYSWIESLNIVKMSILMQSNLYI